MGTVTRTHARCTAHVRVAMDMDAINATLSSVHCQFLSTRFVFQVCLLVEKVLSKQRILLSSKRPDSLFEVST